MLFVVKTSKKNIEAFCKIAQGVGCEVEHRVKGDVDNIYVNGVLVGEIFPDFANVIIEIPSIKRKI